MEIHLALTSSLILFNLSTGYMTHYQKFKIYNFTEFVQRHCVQHPITKFWYAYCISTPG